MVPITVLVVLFALLATLQFGWGVWTVLFVCGLGKPILPLHSPLLVLVLSFLFVIYLLVTMHLFHKKKSDIESQVHNEEARYREKMD